jgi:hypothetical protein
MPVRVVNNISQEYGGILTASRKLSRKLSVTLKEEKGLLSQFIVVVLQKAASTVQRSTTSASLRKIRAVPGKLKWKKKFNRNEFKS